MGLDDIAQGGAEESAQRAHARRQLRIKMMPACEELSRNGKAELERALIATSEFDRVGYASTGFPPPATETSDERSFSLTTRSRDGQLEFNFIASVRCRIENERLTFQRGPVSIEVVGHKSYPPATALIKFNGISGGDEDTRYVVNDQALKTTLEELAWRIYR